MRQPPYLETNVVSRFRVYGFGLGVGISEELLQPLAALAK